MNLHAHGRRQNERVLGRRGGARIAVALLATAALCLGPAVAAQADEATNTAAVETPQVETPVEAPADTSSTDAAVADTAAPAESGGEEAAVAAEPPAPEIPDQVAPAEDGSNSSAAAPEAASDPGTDPAADPADPAAPEAAGEPVADEEGATAVTSAALPASAAQNKDEGNTDTNGHQGITICHATSSDTNPYVIETPDADSMFRENGHTSHSKLDGTRSDVIPAFWYVKNGNKHEYSLPGTGEYYPGKNLDETGIYMLSHGCNMPPEPEQPTIIAISPECLPAEEGASVLLRAVLGNLTDGESYTVTVTLAGQPVGEPDEFTADGDSEQWSRAVTAAGTYTITVTGPGDASASTQSTVRSCEVPPEPPQIEVIPGPCITPSDDVEAELMLTSSTSIAEIFGTGLEAGESYLVSVTKDGSPVFQDTYNADGDGEIYVEVELSEPGTYVASITGPGESDATVSEEFEVAECPPVPVVTPMLTATAACTGGTLQATLSASELEPGAEYPVMVSGPAGFGWNGTLTASEAGSATATVALSAIGNYSAELEGAPAASFTVEKTCTPQVVTPAAGPALPNTGSSEAQPLLWAGVLAMILAVGLMLEPVMTRRMRR